LALLLAFADNLRKIINIEKWEKILILLRTFFMTLVVFLLVATAILIGTTGYLFYVYSIQPTTNNLIFSLVFLVGTLVFVFMVSVPYLLAFQAGV
jgi:hypothetical protein